MGNDTSDHHKEYKLNYISNQEVTFDDYNKLQSLRKEEYKMEYIEKDVVFMKKTDLKHARTYIYKLGEKEQIASDRFERALITGDLKEFPNVSFFYKQYILDRDIKVQERQDAI